MIAQRALAQSENATTPATNVKIETKRCHARSFHVCGSVATVASWANTRRLAGRYAPATDTCISLIRSRSTQDMARSTYASANRSGIPTSVISRLTPVVKSVQATVNATIPITPPSRRKPSSRQVCARTGRTSALPTGDI